MSSRQTRSVFLFFFHFRFYRLLAFTFILMNFSFFFRSQIDPKNLRSRFRSSEDLVHRLFVCIAGVADQLQTNYSSEIRKVLKLILQPSEIIPVYEVVRSFRIVYPLSISCSGQRASGEFSDWRRRNWRWGPGNATTSRIHGWVVNCLCSHVRTHPLLYLNLTTLIFHLTGCSQLFID